MYLNGKFTAAGGAGVAIDLTGARVGGTLEFDRKKLTVAADSPGWLAVDRLTYRRRA